MWKTPQPTEISRGANLVDAWLTWGPLVGPQTAFAKSLQWADSLTSPSLAKEVSKKEVLSRILSEIREEPSFWGRDISYW